MDNLKNSTRYFKTTHLTEATNVMTNYKFSLNEEEKENQIKQISKNIMIINKKRKLDEISEDQIKTVEENYKIISEKNNDMKKSIEEFIKINQDLQKENSELIKKTNESSLKNDDLKKVIDDTKLKNDDLKKVIDDTKSKNDDLKKEIEETKLKNSDLEKKNNKQENELKKFKKENSDNIKEFNSLLKDLSVIVFIDKLAIQNNRKTMDNYQFVFNALEKLAIKLYDGIDPDSYDDFFDKLKNKNNYKDLNFDSLDDNEVKMVISYLTLFISFQNTKKQNLELIIDEIEKIFNCF
jgi:chromosome segregation ATPase